MSTGFSRTSSIRVLAVLLLGVVIAGCLDRVVTGPDQAVASLAARLVIDNGGGQSGSIGGPLTTYLRVLVVDQSDIPVRNGRVNWAVSTGGGTLSKSFGSTDSAGHDSVAWTLGTTAGAQTVTASVTGLPAVTFTATATGSVSVDNGNSQIGSVSSALPTFLRVKVTGPSGTAISGVTVNWTSAVSEKPVA